MNENRAILDYSFCEIDILHYIENFVATRKKYLDHVPVAIRKQYAEVTAKQPGPWFDFRPADFRLVSSEDGLVWTASVLCQMIENWSLRRTLNNDNLQMINNFQRRFEVDRELKESYREDFKKNEAAECRPSVYALFSMVLAQAYLQTHNLNYFNTALKVNDLVVNFNGGVTSDCAALCFMAIQLESSIIQDICAI